MQLPIKRTLLLIKCGTLMISDLSMSPRCGHIPPESSALQLTTKSKKTRSSTKITNKVKATYYLFLSPALVRDGKLSMPKVQRKFPFTWVMKIPCLSEWSCLAAAIASINKPFGLHTGSLHPLSTPWSIPLIFFKRHRETPSTVCTMCRLWVPPPKLVRQVRAHKVHRFSYAIR